MIKKGTVKIGLLGLCLIFFATGMILPGQLCAQDPLEVVKVVLSEPELEPGEEQLVQISLRNVSKKEVRVGLKVEIRAGKKMPTGIRKQRVVSIPAGGERRAFFPLKVPDIPGNYNVMLVVFTSNFNKNLLSGNPEFFTPFLILGDIPPQGFSFGSAGKKSTRTRKDIKSFEPPSGLKFEKPDLIWENFQVQPTNILVDEKIKIKADLRNIGGDLARTIDIGVHNINVRLPNRINIIATSFVSILAPGEKIEMEFEHQFPEDTLLGEYHIILQADTADMVVESHEENNRQSTDIPIRISTIRQVFPEPNFVFDEAGLFLFRWNSRKYDEFKVQVGTEPTFENSDNFFDIPQGGKWTKDNEVVPLPGEMPSMLVGLMIKVDTKIAYWRVVGRLSGTDKQGFSLTLPFRISEELEAAAINNPEFEDNPEDLGGSAGPSFPEIGEGESNQPATGDEGSTSETDEGGIPSLPSE